MQYDFSITNYSNQLMVHLQKELLGLDVFRGFQTAVKHFSSFELLQFIVAVEQLLLHFNSFQLEQDSTWSDMRAFSGETTTTSGLDGRIFTFRATSTAVW